MSGTGTGTRGFHRTEPVDEPAGTPHPLSGGVIAAIVSAVIVAVVLLGVVVLCIRRWRKRRRAQPHALPPRARVPAETALTRTQAIDSGDRAQGQATATSSQETEDSQSPEHSVDVEGCGICRRTYDDAPPDVLECGHGFHPHCISRWLMVNLSCPTCNATNIRLTGDTGEASAPRHRYTSSSMDFDLPRSRDDIDIHRSSFRV
ncbi:hypothetical protein ACQ4PT_017025 [Festuca glaucescens]